MNLKRVVAALIVASCALWGCRPKVQLRNRLDENRFPKTVLWAWERPEDLRFIDSHRFAVAFLAQTLVLKGDDVIFNPRRQPLEVPPDCKLMAVTRIESQKTTGEHAALSDIQKQKLLTLILKTLELRNVAAVQIDFDAAASERQFYGSLLQDLRQRLPNQMPLSMTALASFCVGDRWLENLPVDDAVPMIFRMGADEPTIKRFLANGYDFREPLCRRSYGVSVDEPLSMKFDAARRLYVFNSHPWTERDVASLEGDK